MADMPVLYKLMILYMLGNVNFAMTNSQISGVFLELRYTDYFKVQNTLSDMVESGLIQADEYSDRTYYSLTPAGKDSLDALKNDLSSDIRSDIDAYLKKNRLEFLDEVSVRAAYYRTTGGDYAAHCVVLEHNQPLIDLTLAVPTAAAARQVCDAWHGRNQEVYAQIMQILLEEKQEE